MPKAPESRRKQFFVADVLEPNDERDSITHTPDHAAGTKAGRQIKLLSRRPEANLASCSTTLTIGAAPPRHLCRWMRAGWPTDARRTSTNPPTTHQRDRGWSKREAPYPSLQSHETQPIRPPHRELPTRRRDRPGRGDGPTRHEPAPASCRRTMRFRDMQLPSERARGRLINLSQETLDR